MLGDQHPCQQPTRVRRVIALVFASMAHWCTGVLHSVAIAVSVWNFRLKRKGRPQGDMRARVLALLTDEMLNHGRRRQAARLVAMAGHELFFNPQ